MRQPGYGDRLQLFWRRTGLILGFMGLIGFNLAGLAQAQTPPLTNQLQNLAHIAAEGKAAAEQNNPALMQAEYEEIHATWATFEDGIREQNPRAYVELESAMAEIKYALQAEPVDPATVYQTYDHLFAELNEVAAGFGEGASAAPTSVEVTPADLVQRLNVAYGQLEAGDTEEAAEQLQAVIRAWPAVEGAIATKSPEAYTAIEIDLGRAMAALEAEPADLGAAEAAVERLRAALSPFVTSQTYTMFDAAAIILREGLEALLVIVALLAFLNRSGNGEKQSWIWLGGGLGIVASLLTAFALQAVFSYASAGQNREVIEGITGLIAAGLLFYVSYWLHSKASLHAWQKYINVRTTQALARGSMAGLALLAFLAVFREGAETTIFYLGMAPAISAEDLWLGIGLGLVVLVVVAVLMLKVGLKLPLRLFFRIAGLLVYYLGFKFVGTGLHALQVGNILPASPLEALPAVPFLGIYPTWETFGTQLLLLVAALFVLALLWRQDRQEPQTNVVATSS